MTVKELRDVLKNFDDDLTVITKKTDFFEGNVGFVNNVRKSSFSFMFVDMPCVLLTDEPQEERTESENVWNIGDRVRFKTSGGWYNSGIIRDEVAGI